MRMRVYSREFRILAVRRVLAGEKVAAVSHELDIHRKLLYEWLRRVSEGGEANLRERGRPRKMRAERDGAVALPHRQIAELERTIAQQRRIIEFFRHALQQTGKLRHSTKAAIGATASIGPLRP